MSFLRRRREPATTPQTGPVRDAIAWGWNGLRWGASLGEFTVRFARADGKTGGSWRTGAGPEEFCGVVMDAQYAFNSRGELYLVAFYPGVTDRERLPVAALNELGRPDGANTRWSFGEVEVDVKVAGTVATMTHRRLATR